MGNPIIGYCNYAKSFIVSKILIPRWKIHRHIVRRDSSSDYRWNIVWNICQVYQRFDCYQNSIFKNRIVYGGALYFIFFFYFMGKIFNPQIRVDFSCPLVVIFRVRQQGWQQGSIANVDPCLITDQKKDTDSRGVQRCFSLQFFFDSYIELLYIWSSL